MKKAIATGLFLCFCALLAVWPLLRPADPAVPAAAQESESDILPEAPPSTPPEPVSYPVVVIDAGHGGFDGGAIGLDGVIEKDLNLAIALRLREILRVYGIDTVMTRQDDTTLEDDPTASNAKRKGSDTRNRAALAEAAGDNVLFVSLHQNKYEGASSFGAQIFYGTEHAESQAIAEHLQACLIEQLQPENYRAVKRGTDSIYLLTHLHCPTILIECGFLSNRGDVDKLTDETYQNQLAFVIANGIVQYYAQQQQPAAPTV